MSISETYRIVERLGNSKRRKFGDVFLVKEKATGNRAVLKVVRASAGNQTALQRLIHEATFDFDHPGLPKIIEFEQTENECLLLRNYTPGIPLDQYWEQLKRKERHGFLQQLLIKLTSIFEELQLHSIVHGDLKPGNILIEKKANDFDVHLIDFGLSLNTSDPEKRDILFPLGYAAPELLLNHLDLVNQSTDVYALGIILWRLYAEKLPLVHRNPSIFTNLQLTHPLPEHDSIPKSVFPILAKMSHKHSFATAPNKMHPQEVQELLKTAMNERYQTFKEVADQLKKIKAPKWWQR